MKKRLLVASFAVAAMAPLAAQAYGGVSVSVHTPEFGIRIGAPFYRPYAPVPVYAPAPVYVPTPVYPEVVYAPPPVVYAPTRAYMPPARVVYAPPVYVAPRVAYPRAYIPPPRVVVPHEHRRYTEYQGQRAGYWVPPGHARRQRNNGHYQ